MDSVEATTFTNYLWGIQSWVYPSIVGHIGLSFKTSSLILAWSLTMAKATGAPRPWHCCNPCQQSNRNPWQSQLLVRSFLTSKAFRCNESSRSLIPTYQVSVLTGQAQSCLPVVVAQMVIRNHSWAPETHNPPDAKAPALEPDTSGSPIAQPWWSCHWQWLGN